MIKEIKIENFKSIQSLNLELGRLNVFIGANGSGKSNILEGIAFGSAAASGKLYNEFLSNRGIRATEGKYFTSGFNNYAETINIKIKGDNEEFYNYIIAEKYPHWEVITNGDLIEGLYESTKNNFDKYVKDVYRQLHSHRSEEEFEKISQSFMANLVTSEFVERLGLDTFMIFAPENHFLRKLEDETPIKPLGIHGEGLLSYLITIIEKKLDKFIQIKSYLNLIDWFEDIQIPYAYMYKEPRLNFHDIYLTDGIGHFDQRNVNDGTLYLLFYLTLFISDETPKFFAIDNIDNAMNPKLGSELIRVLTKLAKEHDKQTILTTHNPSVLDGLDLSDDEQRLFVISRNKSGHTQAIRVPYKESDERLSTRFIRGAIGGLPKNF